MCPMFNKIDCELEHVLERVWLEVLRQRNSSEERGSVMRSGLAQLNLSYLDLRLSPGNIVLFSNLATLLLLRKDLPRQ
jgi:hypothetical protein